MIVQVAPVEKNVGETVASLNFAQRVRSVELGQATRKVTESSEVTGKLEVVCTVDSFYRLCMYRLNKSY